jgi:two-component system OmpR family response regulator/two-component system phosphate regulon response regulator OmpR
VLASIQALLRRSSVFEEHAVDAPKKVRFGKVEIDFDARTLTRSGQPAYTFTTGEFSVLSALLNNPRKTLSRDQLMALSRSRERGPFDRAIDVQISRLRKLIESNIHNPRYIQTIWGRGYMFVPDKEEEESE